MCKLEENELLRVVKRRKLKFLGHLMRHDNLQRMIIEGRTPGRRGRGRPRRRWEDEIRHSLGLNMRTAGLLAQAEVSVLPS